MVFSTPNARPESQIPKLSLGARWSAYKELSKSGIVALVLISVFGGYLIGQPLETLFSLQRMLLTLFGVLFLSSGASALNQLQEVQVDAKMPRTSKRPLPSGRISKKGALGFIVVSVVAGLILLSMISRTELWLGVLAVVSYNGFYTLWWKKHWAYAAVPGAIPGALPILMGHVAVTNQLWAPSGIYLFFILFFWQMPHFWALALRYRDDYAVGQFPTLPVARGQGVTVFQIVLWCLAYVAVALVAPLFLKVGAFYLSVTLLMSLKLLWELVRFVKQPESSRWLHFFLWINFSLIAYIGAAAIDLWSVYLIPYFTR
jgi:protoheme IX farnesyltransferase